MTTISSNPISKSFIVGRPINATVSQYDVVTLVITLTDDRGNIIDLTGCSVQASTVDTEAHLWTTTVLSPATDGKFTFTFQPLVVGKTEVYAMVTKTVGQDEVTTTFYIGDVSVAYTEGEPAAHITSLTTQLQTAATSANTAATSANTAATRANSAAAVIEGASIDVGTVTSGTTPAVTKRGSGVNPIFDFVLAKGDKGDTGATGPQGAKGDKGDTGETGATGTAATISVGSVTTGAAGSQAIITNSGTSSAAVFDFTIPKGDKGDTGTTIDDTTTATDKVWSSNKVNSELAGKQATLSTAQTNAVNSGITSSKVSNYDSHIAATNNPHDTALADLTDCDVGSQIPDGYILKWSSDNSKWKIDALSVSKEDVGLGNVDNTSDANKPISTATQTALNAKQSTLTTEQLAAANSGITSSKVTTYDGYAATIAGKADKATTLSGYGITDAYTKTETDTLLAAKEATANKVTSLSASSTDTEYPSAKCVYDLIGDVETLINAL